MTKQCKVCGVTDNHADFYNGINNKCKECHKSAVRENRLQKVDYYRKYDAKRYRSDPRVRARIERYLKTDAGKKKSAAAKKRWQEKEPVKRAAHVILGNAVRDGKIKKPTVCSICGSHGKIHGHHEDYTKPLDVIWCCPKCHVEIHKGDI